MMSSLARHEGLPSLYRGLVPSLMITVPSTVGYYVGYEYVVLSVLLVLCICTSIL